MWKFPKMKALVMRGHNFEPSFGGGGDSFNFVFYFEWTYVVLHFPAEFCSCVIISLSLIYCWGNENKE